MAFERAILREGFLSRFFGVGLRKFLIAAIAGLVASVCLAQDQAQSPSPNQTQSQTQEKAPSQAPPQAENRAQKQTPITLDTSETLFAVLTGMNACGYDVNQNISDAQRVKVRTEVQKNLRDSEEAQAALKTMCEWYMAHRGKDPQHDLSQFVSLALYLQGPPHFLPRVKDDEMPPDAAPLTGFGAVLERFYDKAALHSIWEAHRADYTALVRAITCRWPRWCSTRIST